MLRASTAAATDGGILIVSVYESKDACDRFVQETLMPLMPIEGGLVGPPEARGAEMISSTEPVGRCRGGRPQARERPVLGASLARAAGSR